MCTASDIDWVAKFKRGVDDFKGNTEGVEREMFRLLISYLHDAGEHKIADIVSLNVRHW